MTLRTTRFEKSGRDGNLQITVDIYSIKAIPVGLFLKKRLSISIIRNEGRFQALKVLPLHPQIQDTPHHEEYQEHSYHCTR